MATVTERTEEWSELERASGKWWVLVVSGIIWIVVAVLVLDADLDSARTIGYLVSGFLLAAGVMEFLALAWAERWKWLHGVLGVLFVLGGIAALTEPLRTFGALASLIGLFLVIKGTFDFVLALAARPDLWVLTVIFAIFEVALGFWAAGYPGRSASLLLLWVGLGALTRGILQLVLAFQVRKLHKAVT